MTESRISILDSRLEPVRRTAHWLALPIGAALSLAFEPFDFWPLAYICPAWLFIAWQDASPKRAALIGFLFTSGTFLAGTYWLYHSVYVIGKAPLPVAIFLMLALVAIMGAYTALFGYCQARWFPKAGYARYLLALPAAWVLLEWIRGWLFSGFPWLALGYAGVGHALGAYAPIVGVYGVSWLYILVAGAVAGATHHDPPPPIYSPIRKQPPFWQTLVKHKWLLTFLALIYVSLGAAIFVEDIEWTEPVGKKISVAIVQGSVPQEMKWTPEQRDATLNLYRDLTEPHLGAELIVWPESALPDWAESLTPYFNELWRSAQARGSHLLTGIQHYDVQADKAYNSVLALSDRAQWYNKRHLVPFGEYFPVPSFIREWMRLMSLPHSDFSAGDDDQPALGAAGQKIAVTICYEDAYGSDQLKILNHATLLVNVTNDSWFGDSTARHQHLQISRMRALEAGRPLVRAANDGISAIIDAQGQIVDRLPSFKAAVLTGKVQPRSGLTPYARVGNWPVVIFCALSIAIVVLLHRPHR